MSIENLTNPGQPPADGDWIKVNGKVTKQYWSPSAGPTVHTAPAATVLVNGNPASTMASGDYSANVGDTVEASTTLDDSPGISYPGATLKMPIVRHAAGKPTTDEIYFDVTIIDDVLTATGQLPHSGDWKMLNSRVNLALQNADIPWRLSTHDVTVIV